MSLTCLCQTDSFIFVVFQKLDHSDVSKNRFAQIRIWWRQYWEEDNIVWRQTHLCMKELVAIFCRNVWLISECGRAHTACMCTCACSCSGVLFRYCRKHPTDDCHSQRNGGRRKQWCDWVIFSWTACSQASWIILKTLQERLQETSLKQLHKSSVAVRPSVSPPSTVTDDTSGMCLEKMVKHRCPDHMLRHYSCKYSVFKNKNWNF